MDFTEEVAEVPAATPATEKMTKMWAKKKDKILQRVPSVGVAEEVGASVLGSSEEVDHVKARYN